MLNPPLPPPADSNRAVQLLLVEIYLRRAARLLEFVGVTDTEAARMARIVFRLAQCIGTDAGRLERVA